MLAAALVLLPAQSPTGALDVIVEGLRSPRGTIQVCLTADPAFFPACADDPHGRKATVPVAEAGLIRFIGVPAGEYAVALFHDENANDRLDTFAGVPREGVGFSGNPRLLFGPPRFAAARFTLGQAAAVTRVRIKYFL